MTDPRFDPAFQRGYAGPPPELVVRSAPAAPPVAPVPPTVSDPGAALASNFSVVPRHSEPPPAAAAWETPAPRESPTQRVSPRNPFRLLLLGLAPVLLLAAGGALYRQVAYDRTQQLSFTTAQDQFVAQFTYALTPTLALAGLTAFILWLALGALDRIEPRPTAEYAIGATADPAPGDATAPHRPEA